MRSLAKTAASNRTEAAAFAVQAGLPVVVDVQRLFIDMVGAPIDRPCAPCSRESAGLSTTAVRPERQSFSSARSSRTHVRRGGCNSNVELAGSPGRFPRPDYPRGIINGSPETIHMQHPSGIPEKIVKRGRSTERGNDSPPPFTVSGVRPKRRLTRRSSGVNRIGSLFRVICIAFQPHDDAGKVL